MEIPKLDTGKCSLIISDYSTGIILNKDYSSYLNSGDDYFYVVESEEQAFKLAESKLLEKGNIEVAVYNHKGDFIRVFRP
ncbi:MAG: hypothetical protein ACFB0B_21830 [Thermonemataceae bacterium]